jgi:D-glycero-beta-D-manno-heptose-7-phosphate kinase
MKLSFEKYSNALKNLDKIKIIVIGDLILDEYLFGEVHRISPEAPVPIVLVNKSNTTLGGAGNVVKNLSSFQVHTGIMGRIGEDEKGKKALDLLKSEFTDESSIFLLKDKSIPTILKTRVIAAHQQVCRVDHEKIENISLEDETKILNYLHGSLDNYQGIILSDYDKGFLTPSLIQKIIELAVKKNIFISADPQVSHFFAYRGISVMTPNHHEAGKALGRKLNSEREIELANEEICEKLGSESMMITRGDKGLSIYTKKDSKHTHIPTVAKQVFDVTGAGDTVISLYTLFRVSGLSEVESSLLANAGAGIVVEKLGAETVSRDELSKSMKQVGIFE